MALNYKLGADTLNRVRDADKATANMEFGSNWVDAAEDFEDAVVAKQEYSNIANMAWEEGFASMGDRGSWASGDLFDQFQDMEGGYKETYLEMVRSGDKMGTARLLKDQQARSNSLQSWKETMETAKGINDDVGWSDILDEDDKHILGSLASQRGVSMRIDENNEMVFDVTMPDESIRSMTRRQVDEMTATGIAPKKMRAEQVERNVAVEQYAKEGREWEDVESQYTMQNESRVTEQNYKRWMVDNIAGGKFIDHIEANPEFKQRVVVNLELGPDGVDGTSDDIELTNADIKAIVGLMKDDYKVAAPYIVEWLTLKDKSTYTNQTTRDQEALDRQHETDILRASKASLQVMGYNTEPGELD